MLEDEDEDEVRYCHAWAVSQSCKQDYSSVGVYLFLGSPLLIVTCKPCIIRTVVPNSNYLLACVCGVAVSQTVYIRGTLRLCSAA